MNIRVSLTSTVPRDSCHFETRRIKTVPLVFADQLKQRLFFVERARRLELVKCTEVKEDALLEVSRGILVDEGLERGQRVF